MKIFDRLSDIERHVGCSITIPDWYVGEYWLIFESDEPYTYRFVDYSADIDIHKNSDYSKDWLVLNPNTFYKTLLSNINMEQYITSYKHLIGCEVCHQVGTSLYTNIITSVSDCNPFGTSGVVHDARGLYENQLPFNLLKFYLDENATGTYEEYMQLHYPEYEHVWSKQL